MTERAELFGGYYRNKRVLVTGHTGFKGTWLCTWLGLLGAKVTGYSKDIPTSPSAFELLGLESRLQHVTGDVRDAAKLASTIREVEPDCIFHLAAQPIVRLSYADPAETFATNVLGTVHLFDALRGVKRPLSVVNVTSDKCYENRDWEFGYRETDAMGGVDPYSASKGCAELVFSSFARSFFKDSPVCVGSARAGNVVGGGDYASDRIVPDCVRAWSRGERVVLRNPGAVRPWQHVLEPLGGYLALGTALGCDDARLVRGEGFNFGPTHESFRTVAELVEGLRPHFSQAQVELLDAASRAGQPHEARTLKLSIDRASERLGWRPTLTFARTLEWTADWYRAALDNPTQLAAMTRTQIHAFGEGLTSGRAFHE